jgi:hypothetical protein
LYFWQGVSALNRGEDHCVSLASKLSTLSRENSQPMGLSGTRFDQIQLQQQLAE